MKCSALIADHTGYQFSECRRPAKWDVGTYGLRCGMHARGKWFEKIRKPIVREASEKLRTELNR